MKRTCFEYALAGAIVASTLACGGDSTGVEAKLPAALVGTWVANSTCSPACGYVLTSVSNPETSIDLVANQITTVTLGLNADGSATLNLLGFTEAGSARVDGSTLLLSSGGTTDTVDYVVTSTTLDLHFRTQVAAVDFNHDQVPDLASQHAILKRQ